jgi:hypothetical protein
MMLAALLVCSSATTLRGNAKSDISRRLSAGGEQDSTMGLLMREEKNMLKQKDAVQEDIKEDERKEGYFNKELGVIEQHIAKVHEDDVQSGIIGEKDPIPPSAGNVRTRAPVALPSTPPTLRPTMVPPSKPHPRPEITKQPASLIGCMHSNCCGLVQAAGGIPCQSMLHSNALNFMTSACSQLKQEARCTSNCQASRLSSAVKPMCQCVESKCSKFNLAWSNAVLGVRPSAAHDFSNNHFIKKAPEEPRRKKMKPHRLGPAPGSKPQIDYCISCIQQDMPCRRGNRCEMSSPINGCAEGACNCQTEQCKHTHATAHIDVASLQHHSKQVDIKGLMHGDLQGQDPAEVEQIKQQAQQAWKTQKKMAWSELENGVNSPAKQPGLQQHGAMLESSRSTPAHTSAAVAQNLLKGWEPSHFSSTPVLGTNVASAVEQERKKEQLVMEQTRVEDAETSVKQAWTDTKVTKEAMAMANGQRESSMHSAAQFLTQPGANSGGASFAMMDSPQVERSLDMTKFKQALPAQIHKSERLRSFHVSVSKKSVKTRAENLAETYTQLAKIKNLEKLQRQMEHQKINSLEQQKMDDLAKLHPKMEPIHVGLGAHEKHVENVEHRVQSQFDALEASARVPSRVSAMSRGNMDFARSHSSNSGTHHALHDVQVLTSIRDGTGFRNWKKNKGGWGTLEQHRDIRRCDGVTVELGRLIGIDLEDTGLTGKIPWMAIIRLSKTLQVLKLGGNDELSPSMIPATITVLRRLTILSLHNTNIIGKLSVYSTPHLTCDLCVLHPYVKGSFLTD